MYFQDWNNKIKLFYPKFLRWYQSSQNQGGSDCALNPRRQAFIAATTPCAFIAQALCVATQLFLPSLFRAFIAHFAMAEVVNTVTETGDNKSSGEFQNIHSAYRLNGKNYLKWSQLVRTILKGKGKANHLTEAVPNADDSKFKTWDEEDSMIMAWLWNSMIPEISDTCMFLDTGKKDLGRDRADLF